MDKIEVLGLFTVVDKDNYILDFIKDDSINIEFEYLSDFSNTKILRDYLKNICFLMWLNGRDTTRIILIIDELNNNAIEYWSRIWDINKLRININKKSDFLDLNIEVEDSWMWKKHKTALDMETLRAHQLKLWYNEHNSIRWRWLFMIIVNLVDRLYFRDSKSWWLIVWIKKKIKK